MRFAALDASGTELFSRTSYSVGGGFVVEEGAPPPADTARRVPLPFGSGDELLERCGERGTTPAGVMLANETAPRPEAEVRARLLAIWRVMEACVERGCRTDGVLPGGLRVPRRAPELFRQLSARGRAARIRSRRWTG